MQHNSPLSQTQVILPTVCAWPKNNFFVLLSNFCKIFIDNFDIMWFLLICAMQYVHIFTSCFSIFLKILGFLSLFLAFYFR